jgi:ATP-binding cassette subfamily B multidrug efflux pump
MAGFFQEDEILGKAYDGRLMRRLLTYLRPYKGPVAIAFVLLVFLSFADIAPPIITKFLIDSAIAPAVNGDIPAAEGLRLLVPLGAAYLGVLLASAALRYGQNILTTYVGQRAMYDLRVQLFGHLQSLSLSFFDRNPVGRLMTRITNDIDALTDMVTQGVVSIFGDFLMLIGIAVVLLFLDWRLALLTYATLPIIVALTFYFRKTMRESFRSIRIRLARINAYLNENISGMSIVQLFTREPRAYRQFDELNTDLLNANQGAI